MPYRGYGYGGGDVADYAMQQGQQSQENWNNLIQLIVSFLGQKTAKEQWGQEFGQKQKEAEDVRQFNEKQLALQQQQERRLSQPQPQPNIFAEAAARAAGTRAGAPPITKSPQELFNEKFAEAAGGRAGAPPIENPAQWETPGYSQRDNIDKLLAAFDLEQKNITDELKYLSDAKNFPDPKDLNAPEVQSQKERLKMHQSNITPAQNYLRRARLKITAKQSLDEDTLRTIETIAGDFGRVRGDRKFWEKRGGPLPSPDTTQKDKYEVGKQYTNGAGQTAVYLGNGQFRIVGK